MPEVGPRGMVRLIVSKSGHPSVPDIRHSSEGWASRVTRSWAWQSGARLSSHFCSTTPKAQQPSSVCPRDKWWNLALRSRFESFGENDRTTDRIDPATADRIFESLPHDETTASG